MSGRTLFVSRDIIKKGESPVFDTERDALACLDSLIMDEESVICWNDADISESIYPSLSELAKEIGAIDRIETGPGGRLDITRKVPPPASSGSHRLEIDGLVDIAIEISPIDAGRDKTFSLIGTDEILEIGEAPCTTSRLQRIRRPPHPDCWGEGQEDRHPCALRRRRHGDQSDKESRYASECRRGDSLLFENERRLER